jgi:hypothetical protein
MLIALADACPNSARPDPGSTPPVDAVGPEKVVGVMFMAASNSAAPLPNR